MLALRRLKLIPLFATIAVMAIFAIAIFTARPFTRVTTSPLLDARTVAMPNQPPPPSLEADAVTPSAVMPPAEAVQEPPSEGMASEPPASAADEITPIAVSLPKLTYSYTLGFRLEGSKIAEAQDAHVALCEHMGPMRCQLVAMQRGEADDVQTAASLKLRVASSEARGFNEALIKTVAKSGGRAIQTSVTTEDVSKDIVDAVARIHQREMLVARLTDILRSRRGTVGELVEAERSVAAAQEELDQTRAWLTELRGRVAMSDIQISYQAVAPQASPDTAGDQLGEATLGSGAAFLIAIRSLLTLLIYLIPWALLMVPLFFGARWLARRLKQDSGPEGLPTDG